MVKWRAPKGATTPADYIIRLTVTETYGPSNASGGLQQNIANGTSPVIRLHDSPKELGDSGVGLSRRLRQLLGVAFDVRQEFQRQLPGEGRGEGRYRVEPGTLRYPGLVTSAAERQGRDKWHDGRYERRVQLHIAHHQVQAGGQGVRRGKRRHRDWRLHAHRCVRTAAVAALPESLHSQGCAAGVQLLLFSRTRLTLP